MLNRSVVSDSATPWTAAPPGSSVCGTLQARVLEWAGHFLLSGGKGAPVCLDDLNGLDLPRGEANGWEQGKGRSRGTRGGKESD